MENVFNFGRFKNVLLRILYNNRINYLFLILSIIGSYIVFPYLALKFNLFWIQQLLVLILISLVIYNPFILRFKRNEWEYLLPASTFEKHLAVSLNFILITPALLILTSCCGVELANFFYGVALSEIKYFIPLQTPIKFMLSTVGNMKFLSFVLIFAYQALMLVGSLYFKVNGLFKSTLIGIAIIFMSFAITGKLYGIGAQNNFEKYFLFMNILFSLLTVSLWITSYFIMKKNKI